MKIALGLAEKGLGRTSPNPAVGAVIISGGRIIGAGWHKKAGRPHAEIEAIKDAGLRPRAQGARKGKKGLRMYVTLEPCDHYGRTPPCTDAILRYGIKEVVIAMKDPNPINNGRGIRKLRRNNVTVKVGVCLDEAGRLNESYVKYVTKGMPFVTAKAAQSIDGKIATQTGDSKWITDEPARRYVHILRGQVDAVMVGANTIFKDDPLLTSRSGPGIMTSGPRQRQPLKVVVDGKLKISESSRIFSKDSPARVIIATTNNASRKRIKIFQGKGSEVLVVDDGSGGVDLKKLMKVLASEGVTSVLLEGGGETLASAFKQDIIDKAIFFISAKVIGGRAAVTSVEGEGINRVKNAIKLKDVKIERINNDFLIKGYIAHG